MREVLAQAGDGEQAARLALDVYLHRLCAGIAAMAAALGGVDVLAFTGGVGARSAEVRELAAAGLGFLGVGLDRARNREATDDADVSDPGASVRTLVVTPREDLEIARQARETLREAA
jgi:acetate kinase